MNGRYYGIITAAQDFCHAISEEEMHEMVSALEKSGVDPARTATIAAKLTDLAQAVQDFEAPE